MDPKDLKAFLVAAKQLNFHRAAEKLRTTQPTVSHAMERLEAEVGQLFDRHPRGVTLTAAGEKLLPHAQTIVQALDDARKALRSKREEHGGLLRIAHSPSHREAAVSVVDAMMQRSDGKNLHITIAEMYATRIEGLIRDDELDLGLVDVGGKAKSVFYEQLEDAPLRLIVNPKRRDLASRGRIVKLTELENERFALTRPKLRSRGAVNRFFAAHQFPAKIAVEASSVATVLALVRSVPSLVAILPVPGPTRRELRGLPLLSLPEPVPALGTFLLWRSPDDKLPAKPTARVFRKELIEHLGLKGRAIG